MGKTTKGNQAAGQCRLLSIQPNQVPPGGGQPGQSGTDTLPPADPRFDGQPEGIPELTFIMSPRTSPDDFIDGAQTYHTNCGLNPQMVNSLAHVITILAQSNSRLGRIRLVTHASGEDLIMPFFGQTNVRADRHVFRKHLEGFAHSDERGLLSILDLNQGQHYFSWSASAITSHIRSSNASLLQPFNLHQSGLPEGGLSQFMKYCADRVMVDQNRVKRNNANLGNARKQQLLHAIDTLIDLSLAPSTPGAAALKTFITEASLNDLGANNPTFGYNIPAGALNMFSLVRNASQAVRDGFRSQLTAVRARFDENSIFDIRGCRAGRHVSYLRAVQALFGREDHRPQVTGPRWYQYFGDCPEEILDNNNEIQSFLRNGAGAAANRAAFEEWARRSQINDRHKSAWLELLDTSERGRVIRFCQLNWRNSMLSLCFDTPGWDAFVSMNFTDAIARIGAFFNLAGGSVPSGASLSTINTLVTTQLDGFATFLLASIDESNKTANFSGLSDIDSQLGTSLVPDTAPNPLQVSAVQGFQNDLIDHLESNQLSAIRDFMQACRARIEDEDNPGIYYYMLHIGMPVFTFSDEEEARPGHRLRIRHNRIVVHQDHQQTAFRQWIRSLWEGDLPPANTIDTLTINSDEARRFALMLEDATPGDRRVHACPHPGYMQQLETVTNTSDPFEF